MIRKVNAKKLFVDKTKLEDRLEEVAKMTDFIGYTSHHVTFMHGMVIIGKFHFWLRPVRMPQCNKCGSINWFQEDYRYMSREDKSKYISLLVGTCLKCAERVAFTF